MNKYLVNVVAAALLGPASFGQQIQGPQVQDKYAVTGDVKGLNDMTLYMVFSGYGDRKDSTVVSNGHFSFTGHIAEPAMAIIYGERARIDFFIENKDIHISGNADSLENVHINGSSTQMEYEDYKSSMKDITNREEVLYGLYDSASAEKDTAALAFVKTQLSAVNEQRKNRMRKYIETHPASPVSLYELKGLTYSDDFPELEKLFTSLDNSQQNSVAGKNFAKELAILKKLAIGQPALDFTQKDLEGRAIQLAQYNKGKYILLDFWASWCGPCRAENPNVLKAYNQFKDKQFDVLGVSLDNDGAKWKDAVQKDGMPWTEVSDLKGWKNEAARQYNINGIPSNFLLDPHGIIIAKNLRGADLEKKLAEIIK
jgi:peroxiredoxin